jgi:hypothetical protein
VDRPKDAKGRSEHTFSKEYGSVDICRFRFLDRKEQQNAKKSPYLVFERFHPVLC